MCLYASVFSYACVVWSTSIFSIEVEYRIYRQFDLCTIEVWFEFMEHQPLSVI